MTAMHPAQAQSFVDLFPKKPFAIRHDLASDPLLSLNRLASLVRELPRDMVEYNSGKVAVNQDPSAVASVDLAPDEVVRRIETCGAWMVLKRVEQSPAYRALLEAMLLSVARAQGHASLTEAGFYDIRGFIFVSSPQSTTPFHVDSEDNFFVHVHGDKTFCIYDNEDRSILSEEMIEETMIKHRNIPFDKKFDVKAHAFRLQAGDGVFVPYQWPHWVKTGDAYSISMAITWKTRDVQRRNDIILVNSKLRAWGFPQQPPGVHPALDGVKLAAFRAMRLLVSPLQKSEAMRRVVRSIVLGRHANYFYRATDKQA
jgi:hypothetical protein